RRDAGRNTEDLFLLISGPDPTQNFEYAYSETSVRSSAGEWITLETSINTRRDDQIRLTSTLWGSKNQILALLNLILAEEDEMKVVMGNTFGLTHHPINYLSHLERPFEIKEVSLTRR